MNILLYIIYCNDIFTELDLAFNQDNSAGLILQKYANSSVRNKYMFICECDLILSSLCIIRFV